MAPIIAAVLPDMSQLDVSETGNTNISLLKSIMFIHVYSWLFMFIHVYSWLFIVIHVYSWLFMVIHGYSCLFMVIHVYSCEP